MAERGAASPRRSTPSRAPNNPARLRAVLDGPGVPRGDPRLRGHVGHALADEAISDCGSTRLVDAGWIGSTGHDREGSADNGQLMCHR